MLLLFPERGSVALKTSNTNLRERSSLPDHMDKVIEISGDGSHTLFVPALGEHYHSMRGAVQEAMHVYLRAGLQRCDKQEIHLLEIGFSTRLNAFLTLLDTEASGKIIHYTALEKYPIAIEQARELNYSDIIAPSREEEFTRLHEAPWNEWAAITPRFKLNKREHDVTRPEEFLPDALFDVIYFDAFGPEKQPDMWTRDIFERVHALSGEGAVLTTYCAKGAVRRMLQEIGYRVERLPGPPGKREMLRAIK